MCHALKVRHVFPKTMSYYKIINSIQYDKLLLDMAEGLTIGRGEGRISELEIQSLVQKAQDKKKITAIELATLHYIRQHFKFTDKAATWFDAHFPPKNPTDVRAIIQKIVVEEFQMPGLEVIIEASDVQMQSELSENKISFEQALRASLHSFLNDDKHFESPRGLVENVFELYRDKFDTEEAWNAALTAKVREYLRESSQLVLHPLRPLTEEETILAAPENGEKVQENWIFQLDLRKLSDHLYWAITDRTGEKPTYHYGFNWAIKAKGR